MRIGLFPLWGLALLCAPSSVAALIGGWPGFFAGAVVGAFVILSWRRRLRAELERVGIEAERKRFVPGSPIPRPISCLPREFDRALQGLVREQDRMATTLAAIDEGILVLDMQGRVTLLNASTERLLGIRRDAWFGHLVADVCGNDELRRVAEYAVESASDERRDVVHGDRTLEVYASLSPTRSRVVLVLRDVTEMRRLETMRRDFAANVSHELKTPLTSIQAYVETLLDGGIEDPAREIGFIRKIENNARRLTDLIADLLALSKIESGIAVSTQGAIDLAIALRTSIADFVAGARAKGIEIREEFEIALVVVSGDAEALNRIFDNLIGNAIKYTEGAGDVIVRLRVDGTLAVVDVIDHGIGIPRADLPRVFERFYRVDKARSREKGGTGLGLSIVKHYVEALKGSVSVTSQIGKGSTFTVRLPLVR